MNIFNRDYHSLVEAYKLINEESDESTQPGDWVSKFSPADLKKLRPKWQIEALKIRVNLIKKLTGYVGVNKRHKEWVFGKILQKLGRPVIVTGNHRVNTMAVTNTGKIIIHTDFVGELLEEANGGPEFVEGVLLHEAYHVLNHTFYRQGDRKMELWNIATDYIMNRDLLLSGHNLPSAGLLPENPSGERTQPGDEKQYVNIAKLFAAQLKENTPPVIDITNMTCEELYDAIKDSLKELENNGLEELVQQIIDELIRQQEATDSHSGAGDDAEDLEGDNGDPGEGKGQPGETALEAIAKQAASEINEQGSDQEREDLGDVTELPGEPSTPAPSDGRGHGGGGGIQTQSLDKSTIDCTKYQWKDTIKQFLKGKVTQPVSGRGTRRFDVFDPLLGRMKKGKFKSLPLGRGKAARKSTGDELEAVFIIDVSGSMNNYFQSLKEAIACLTMELFGKFNIGVVLIGSHAASLIEIKTIGQQRLTQDQIFKIIDDQWKSNINQAGGGGISFVGNSPERNRSHHPTTTGATDATGAIEWILYNVKDLNAYKYFFIITDTWWTDTGYTEAEGDAAVKEVLRAGKEICILYTGNDVHNIDVLSPIMQPQLGMPTTTKIGAIKLEGI